MKRKGQKPDESAAEYLMRAASHLESEPTYLLDDLKTVDACLDLFDLWHAYDTDYWQGILECIMEGDSPRAARAFIKKHKLRSVWEADIKNAVEARKDSQD